MAKKAKFDFNLAPQKAIEYLQNKGLKLSFNHEEIIKNAHDKAFTVAKVTRADLLNDIHAALLDSLEKGTPFGEFKKNLKPLLTAKGWWGEKDIMNPATGEVKKVNINSRRLKNIFDTNMRTAYNTARYEQMSKLPLSVYWRYESALLASTRDDHAARHGTIKHRDDPWWENNSPLNGWGCKCKTRAVSKKYIEKKGWKITEGAIEDIADKEWRYDTRKGNKLSKISKINLDDSLSLLPVISSVRKEEYKELSEEELKQQFYNNLGISQGEIYLDKINDPMIIDDNLFTTLQGYSKIKKQDRDLFIDEISKTIQEPDEIYIYFNEQKNKLEKKMFRYYAGDGGGKRAIQIVFEYLKDKTQGVTAYFIKDTKQVEKRRYEKLIYTKGQE